MLSCAVLRGVARLRGGCSGQGAGRALGMGRGHMLSRQVMRDGTAGLVSAPIEFETTNWPRC